MEDFNKSDVNLTTYFEEITRCSEDVNDTINDMYNNPELVSLKVGDSFNTFDDAETHICRFAEYKGFKIRLGHVKMVDTTKDIVDATEDNKVVHKVLMERSKEEQKRKQLEEWRQGIPSTASIVTQMKESVYYTASRFTIKEVESYIVYEFSQNKDMDDEPDVVYLSAKYLLESLGLAHTAVNKCMLHRDHEFVGLIEAYLEKIHAREHELQETAVPQYTIEEGNVMPIANPRKVVTKGRPRLAGHDQNVVTHEKSSKKWGQYTCGFCKEPGHNIATCLHKAK
ncbi:6094_t:CDS:2, partial [Racocetra persica]